MRSMLGKVAKGARRFGEHVVGESTKAAEEANDTESEVEALLQRLSGASIHPEYRREAMTQLKDLLADHPKAQLAFGSMGGVTLLISVLQDDRDDVDLLRGALECFVHAMRQPPSQPSTLPNGPPRLMTPHASAWDQSQMGCQPGHGQHPYQQLLTPHPPAAMPGNQQALEAQAAAINAELLARRQENVLLLLALLEDEPVGINDFYVRYHTVQLLTVLLQACAYKLQDAILSSRGVVRLMDMLVEREVIRNEALVLLVALTFANEEVQKIAAFEGAFDRLFHIIKEEEGAQGGVVVQDCLELLNNLLRANVANQRLFREMGYFSQLTQLFTSALPATSNQGLSLEHSFKSFTAGGPANDGIPISQQKAAILLCALETVMLLVARTPDPAPLDSKPAEQSHCQANATTLLKQGMLEALLPLCLTDGGVATPAVSAQALSALGDLVLENKAGQEKLGAMLASTRAGSAPISALQAALHVALHSCEPSKRSAAEHLIRAFCQGNPEGQAALAATLVPVARGTVGLPATFGAELGDALRQGPSGGPAALEVSCRAASVLQHVAASNAAVKDRLLQMPLELPPSPAAAPAELLLARCFRLLSLTLQSKEPPGQTCAILLLRLLLVLLHESPTAIAQMAANAGHLPLVVDALTSRQGGDCVHVQGLSAVLLGVCLLHGNLVVPQQHPQRAQHCCPQNAPIPSPSPILPSDLVFDVLVTRVGLSQFMLKLDGLIFSPAFLAASSAPSLPHQVTRAFAAAVITGDNQGANGTMPRQSPTSPSHSRSSSNLPSHQSSSHGGVGMFPFDHSFTLFVRDLEAQIRHHVVHTFARPRASNGRHVAAGNPMELLASLPGMGDAQKLHVAVDAILKLGQAADELQAQNQALHQDLGRMAQQQQQQQQKKQQQELQQRLSAGAGSAPRALTDAEAKAQAEERAEKAEAELAAVKQQVELLSARLAQAEQDAAAAQEASASSYSHATKREGDLNTLGEHCQALEIQIRDMQGMLAQAQQQLQAQQAVPTAQGSIPEAEVARKIEEAVAKAVADADANNEEQLTDLLVCLGQEEQKVTALSEKLASYGVDVDALLASIKPEEEDGEGEANGDDELR